jgi:nitrogen fixation NifU-like protein
MNQKDPYLHKDHSLHYMQMAFLSDRHEIMENPDGYGKRTGACGDKVEMFIRVRNEHIQSVTFISNGCINTYACANTVALLAEGKTINKAWGITPEKVASYLKTLPKEDLHCAELAAGALYLALVNYQEHKYYPWKKLYQQRFR